MDLLARAASAISDANLGHMGWALNNPRENKALPEEAKEFLRELFLPEGRRTALQK